MKINQFFEKVLGANLKNPRWSWGAIDRESNRVFLRVWDDQIYKEGRTEKVQVYWEHHRTSSPGYAERLEQLEAIRNGAKAFGVITTAVDPKTRGAREIGGFDKDTLLELGELSKDGNGIYAFITARVPASEVVQFRQLSPKAKTILQLLVNQIRKGRFTVNEETTFLGYKHIHEELGLPKRGVHWGHSLNVQGLGDLALWVRQKQLPALTGLVVNQTNFNPGNGYYEAYNRPLNDRTWWMDQVKQAIAFDWSPYVEDDQVPTAAEILDFTAAINEGKVNTISADVRKRCEALRRRAKQVYRGKDGKLRCEVCEWVKPDNRISGDIVELHHVRSLANLPTEGVKLTMKEAIENLVPLCPTCHRIAHSLIDGRSFSLKELKSFIPKYAAQTDKT